MINSPDVFDLEAEELSQPWDLAVPEIYMADAFDSSGGDGSCSCFGDDCRQQY